MERLLESMTEKVIEIPQINDERADFATLFSIWSQTTDYYENIRFDFSGCDFLCPNAVAFLGGLARLIESRFGTVIFDWDTLRNNAVMTNLCQNGFAGTFGYPSSGWTGNSIPYREDTSRHVNGIMDYLELSWLGREWVHVSWPLRDATVGHLWEIYNNAFEHSGSKIGVFSCGQHFPTHNELILLVVDFGQVTAAGCLRWEFQRGTTTMPKEELGGLGLNLLKEFLRINQDKVEVYSNEGYELIDKDGERFTNEHVYNIVTSLETQLSTLDHLTQTIDSALARAELLRQAILKKAFSGRLVPQDPNDLPAPRPGKWFVYALECDDGSIYIGQTENIEKRWGEHASGKGAEWTKRYPPVKLVHWEEFDSLEEAVKREKELKTGFGRKWLKREYAAGRTRQAGEPASILLKRIQVKREARKGTARRAPTHVRATGRSPQSPRSSRRSHRK